MPIRFVLSLVDTVRKDNFLQDHTRFIMVNIEDFLLKQNTCLSLEKIIKKHHKKYPLVHECVLHID